MKFNYILNILDISKNKLKIQTYFPVSLNSFIHHFYPLWMKILWFGRYSFRLFGPKYISWKDFFQFFLTKKRLKDPTKDMFYAFWYTFWCSDRKDWLVFLCVSCVRDWDGKAETVKLVSSHLKKKKKVLLSLVQLLMDKKLHEFVKKILEK